MKFIFGICILFFFGLEGFAIDKKVPTTAIDSTEKAKAAIDSIKAYDPANKEKVKVRMDDTLVFDDLEAPKIKDNDGQYFINNKETITGIAAAVSTNEKTQSEKMDEYIIPFQADFGKIHPNPATAHALITVDLKEEGEKSIVIRSANGEISKTYSTRDSQLQIVDLSPGIYFLQINLNGQNKTQRLYVQ